MAPDVELLERHGRRPEPPHPAEPRRRVPGGLVMLSELSWRFLACVVAVVVIAYGLWQVRLAVLPVFIALLVATILTPPARALTRRGLHPALATTIVFLGSLLLVVCVVAVLVPPVTEQLGDLGRQVRAGVDQVGEYIASGPFGLSEARVDDAIDQAEQRLQDSLGSLAGGVVSGALLAVELIAGLLITLVLIFFFVKDGPELWGWIVGRFPRGTRERVQGIGESVWRVAGAYVRGLVVVATVDAVFIGLALTLIGVPLVLPLAVLTFFAAFIPLVGAFTAGAAAALVALVSEGVVDALLVVAAVTLVQQIEGDLLYPLVVGRTVQLHPVVILLAVTVGAVLGGIIGTFIAVPLVAILAAVVPVVRARPPDQAREGGG